MFEKWKRNKEYEIFVNHSHHKFYHMAWTITFEKLEIHSAFMEKKSKMFQVYRRQMVSDFFGSSLPKKNILYIVFYSAV